MISDRITLLDPFTGPQFFFGTAILLLSKAGGGEFFFNLAAAATGGSAMPPIMGSAAFILAEYTGTPYREIVYAALIPAFLYYIGVFLQVHLRAVRRDLRPYSGEVPKLSQTFRDGWPFLFPIAIIIGVLMAGYSPVLTAGAGALAVVIGSSLSKRTRMTPWQVIDALGDTTLRILPVAGACAAAGLVIGGLSMTGLGMKAANVIIEVSGGGMAPTLVLAAVITIILGLGMPTPSAYILAAVLVAPALGKIGIPVLESHMFLLYYAILSALTPPIAVAALAAAAIAEEDPFIIAFDAVRLAAVGFLMPFVFIWNPAILGQGTGLEITLVAVGGAVAACAISTSIEWMKPGNLRAAAWPLPALLSLGAVAAVAPNTLVALVGVVATLALLGFLYLQADGQAAETAAGE